MSALDFTTVPTAAPAPPQLYVVGETESPARDDEYARIEAQIGRAEAAIESHEYAEALALLDGTNPSRASCPDLALRAYFAESWSRMYLGQLDAAVAVLERARALAERPAFDDVDRAEALYRLGCCRLKLSQVANASSLFTLALGLCDRSARPCDRLRAHILEWRSRCYQRQRDFEAARADVEGALELAEGIGDAHTVAHVHFQASLVAERQGQWVLARFYAEEALEAYRRFDDRQNVARLLNNLGGLTFLLGRPGEALGYLADAHRLAVELGSQADAAQALSSLAQVHLRTGELDAAEEHARRALDLLGGRVDFLDEIGNVQLVLGRSLLEQARLDEAAELFRAAEQSFERLDSASHRAAVWVAQGDLAARRDDKDAAAALYRRAAESLQDFHF